MKTYDPYEILQLPQGASKGQIKRAYRFLAKRFHPDCNRDDPGAEEKFKQIQQAYSLLMDEGKEVRASTSMPNSRNIMSHFSVSGHPFSTFFSAMRNLYKEKEVKDRSIKDMNSKGPY